MASADKVTHRKEEYSSIAVPHTSGRAAERQEAMDRRTTKDRRKPRNFLISTNSVPDGHGGVIPWHVEEDCRGRKIVMSVTVRGIEGSHLVTHPWRTPRVVEMIRTKMGAVPHTSGRAAERRP